MQYQATIIEKINGPLLDLLRDVMEILAKLSSHSQVRLRGAWM